MFYFMFESRKDPKTAPVVLWMTGATNAYGPVVRNYVSRLPELMLPRARDFSAHLAVVNVQAAI